MIRGYVSSDEDDYDDYDDYDFGYSESFHVNNKSLPPVLPEIQSEEFRKELHSALEKSQQVELFLKAVDDGDIYTLEELIALDVSPDSTDSQGWTALMMACGAGKPDVVEFLLERGANPNKHRELFTPLMTCCTYTLLAEELKLNCASLLLNYGAQVNAKDKYQTTALMYASGSGYKDIVAKLLEIPEVNVNIQDKEGWTALFYAVNHNNIDLTNLLVSAGTDLALKDIYNRTVINLALDKDLKAIAVALGFVEELPAPKPVKKLRLKFLAELPDSKGQGGFPADAKKILSAFNQTDLKKISLPDLLNATDKDLYEIGVKLKVDREKILAKGIHRYHLHPWSNNSRLEIKKGVPLTMEDAVAITGALAKNLTIVNASLRYLDSRISSRKNMNTVDIAIEKTFIIFLIDAYNLNERLKVLLTSIYEHIKQIKPETPADFIYPCKKKKQRKKFVKFFWYSIGAATAGLLIYIYKSNPNFRILHSLPLYLSFWSEDRVSILKEQAFEFMETVILFWGTSGFL